MRLPVLLLDRGIPVPSYARRGDAGLDLCAVRDVTLRPGERAGIGTGVAVALPRGYAGFVHARSGRALAEGLALANAPGVVDSGYRGEIRVIAVNLDASEPIHIRRGDKIAQLVVHRVEQAIVEPMGELQASERGERGFGSSGR